MEGEQVTIRFFWAIFIVCALFDFWVIHRYGIEASISRVLARYGQANPVVPSVLLGIWCHIWWKP